MAVVKKQNNSITMRIPRGAILSPQLPHHPHKCGRQRLSPSQPWPHLTHTHTHSNVFWSRVYINEESLTAIAGNPQSLRLIQSRFISSDPSPVVLMRGEGGLFSLVAPPFPVASASSTALSAAACQVLWGSGQEVAFIPPTHSPLARIQSFGSTSLQEGWEVCLAMPRRKRKKCWWTHV